MTELEVIRTHGDEGVKGAFPGDLSGKAVFTRRIEESLAAGIIDVAVHSLKDLPGSSMPGLTVAAVPRREDPKDVLVSVKYGSINAMPQGAVVGTSSTRRSAQLLYLRPDLRIAPLSGNVGTRVRRLRRTRLDGIVLAAAGLNRLGLQGEIREFISTDDMLPAPGQGALAIQTVRGTDVHDIVRGLEHADTRSAVDAERAFSIRLGGDCNVPVAALAMNGPDGLTLHGCVASPDGKHLLRGRLSGRDAVRLGEELASDLLSQGAKEVLEAA